MRRKQLTSSSHDVAQSIIIFLQSLPTQDWTDKDTELLLSEAFLWSRTFQAR